MNIDVPVEKKVRSNGFTVVLPMKGLSKKVFSYDKLPQVGAKLYLDSHLCDHHTLRPFYLMNHHFAWQVQRALEVRGTYVAFWTAQLQT